MSEVKSTMNEFKSSMNELTSSVKDMQKMMLASQTQGRFSAQPQPNPKPANYVDTTHKQVQAITLRSGTQLDRHDTPTENNQGKKGEPKGLGQEVKRETGESEEKKKQRPNA